MVHPNKLELKITHKVFPAYRRAKRIEICGLAACKFRNYFATEPEKESRAKKRFARLWSLTIGEYLELDSGSGMKTSQLAFYKQLYAIQEKCS